MAQAVLGTMNFSSPHVSEPFDMPKIKSFLTECLASGVKELDTAFYYRNCEALGATEMLPLFKVSSKANPWQANDFTSGHLGQLRRTHVLRQLDTSLDALGIDAFDTYYMHAWDYETPIQETMLAFDEAWRKEKFKTFGVSNVSIPQLLKMWAVSDTMLIHSPKVYQGMYNVYCRRVEEIFPTLQDLSMSFVAYNPLAGGLLSGKPGKTQTGRFSNPVYQSIFWNDEVIAEVQRAGLSAEMCLAWLASQPMVSKVIVGASTLTHLKTNLKALASPWPVEHDRITTFYMRVAQHQPAYCY